MQGWLTPDLSLFSESQETRLISVPGSLWYLISGALGELAQAQNWETFGDATPEESAEFFDDVYQEFLMSSPHYVGEVRAFIQSVLPDDWLPFDGVARLTADYPELAAIIPAAWITGANFTLPLMAGMSPVGEGTHTLFNFVRGAVGGERLHTLTIAELAAHGHTYDKYGISLTGASGGVNKPNITITTPSSQIVGSSTPHNNMQPYLVVRWAIFGG